MDATQQIGRKVSESTSPDHALSRAERICAARSVRLTRIRRGVLELLLRTGTAMRAYEVAAQIETVLGRKLKPTTVYRVLEFLVEQGLVSRIESLSAFVALAKPAGEVAPVFFICQTCGTSSQTQNLALQPLIKRDAATIGFEFGRHAVELRGTCCACAQHRADEVSIKRA